MSDQLPEPLVPSEVDLRGYEFMPLYGDRLKKSETWISASHGGKVAALNLWWHAYGHEKPAGSLPDDDKLLADYAGYGSVVKSWRKVRPQALRGWVKCSDGRLYHHFMSDIVIKAWEIKLADQARTTKGRIAILEKRKALSVTDEEKAHIEGLLQTERQRLSQSLSQSLSQTQLQTRNRQDRTGQDSTKNLKPEKSTVGLAPDDPLITSPEPSGKPNGSRAFIADAEAVMSYLNRNAGKGFEFRNRNGDLTASADRIIGRLKQGYTAQELREVVFAKCAQWKDDEKMAEYLRPATLFTKENFEQYLGEIRGANG